jgi:catechol 2,3-dioxygenase-like lactoylglutathione lyase family enzyme
MFKGVHHTCFITKNINKCIEFYSKLPGIKIVVPLHIRNDDMM